MKKLTFIFFTVLVVIACQNNKKNSTGSIGLAGAGATFPLPFYNQAIGQYSAKTGIKISYGGIGSGGGIKSLKDKVVDFGATDAFLTDAELKEMPAPVIHIPTCLGAVVVAFNLPGIDSLKMKNDVLAGIFSGEITKWNDNRIKADNPGIDLPDLKVSVIYRSDGSGTTFIFTDYLSKISDKWANGPGKGKSINWPAGMGAKGNPGVAGTVKQTTGAIGYIGSEYAFSQKIPFVLLQNQSGNFIKPSVESVSAAAQVDIPSDTRVMLTNSPNAQAYPISGFTWIILYQEQSYNNRKLSQAQETVKFLKWLIGPEGQGIAPKIDYAPLPEKAGSLASQALNTLTFEGKPILP